MLPEFQIYGFWTKIQYKILKEKIQKIGNFKNDLKQNLKNQNCVPSDYKQKPKIHQYPKINSLATKPHFDTQIYRIFVQNPEI